MAGKWKPSQPVGERHPARNATGLILGTIYATVLGASPYNVVVQAADGQGPGQGHVKQQQFALAAKGIKVKFSTTTIKLGYSTDKTGKQVLAVKDIERTVSGDYNKRYDIIGKSSGTEKDHISVFRPSDEVFMDWKAGEKTGKIHIAVRAEWGKASSAEINQEGAWHTFVQIVDFTQGNAVVSNKISVRVAVPTSIAKQKQPFIANWTATNAAINETSPGDPGTPAGKVLRVTLYGARDTIIVLDQFGESLDAFYQGAPITENKKPIKPTVRKDGTYLDFVGYFQPNIFDRIHQGPPPVYSSTVSPT